nr:hypothetical protein [Sunxiuqinia sp.]
MNTFVPESELEVKLAVLNKALLEKDEKLKKYELEIAHLHARKKTSKTATKRKTASTGAKSKK